MLLCSFVLCCINERTKSAVGQAAQHTPNEQIAVLACVSLCLGDVVVASQDIYGGMHRLLRYSAEHSGIHVKFVETWDLGKVEDVIKHNPRVRLLCVESPTNPMMRVRTLSDHYMMWCLGWKPLCYLHSVFCCMAILLAACVASIFYVLVVHAKTRDPMVPPPLHSRILIIL